MTPIGWLEEDIEEVTEAESESQTEMGDNVEKIRLEELEVSNNDANELMFPDISRTPRQTDDDSAMRERYERLVREPLTTAPRREQTKRSVAEVARQLETDQPVRSLFQKHHSKSKRNDVDGWGKSCKPDPFPKGLPAAKQHAAWIDWKKQFEVSLELMNATTQQVKANLLFLHVGEEIREIIGAYGFMPDRTKVREDYEHYDNVLAKLDKYFQEATDETIDMETLWAMKQEQDETCRVFLTRLMRQTSLCGLHEEKIVRTNLLRGMSNRNIAQLAMANDWELQQIVKAATREEALVVKQQPLSWFGNKSTSAEIFQLEKAETRNEEKSLIERPKERIGTYGGGNVSRSFKRPRYEPDRRERTSDVRPCSDCGIRFHRYGVCPAIGKACSNCQKIGHFARVCRTNVNYVQKTKEESDDNDEVKIYN